MLAATKPAVFYAVRRLTDPGKGVLADVQALLIAEGLRSPDAAWRGDGETAGAYALAEEAAKVLAQPDLAGTAGMWLRHQQLAYVDGRIVAFTQDYDVMQSGEQVLIDGAELIGGRCLLQLVKSGEAAVWQSEGLAGSEERWASWQGCGPAAVAFAGTLWAADEAGLRQIEQRLEDLLADRSLHDLTTGSGRTWQDVALVSWQRIGGRIAQPILGLTGQQVQIQFEQYRQ